MGRKSQESMTGHSYEGRRALGERRTQVYLQRGTQAFRDRLRGKVAVEPTRPRRKEVAESG